MGLFNDSPLAEGWESSANQYAWGSPWHRGGQDFMDGKGGLVIYGDQTWVPLAIGPHRSNMLTGPCLMNRRGCVSSRWEMRGPKFPPDSLGRGKGKWGRRFLARPAFYGAPRKIRNSKRDVTLGGKDTGRVFPPGRVGGEPTIRKTLAMPNQAKNAEELAPASPGQWPNWGGNRKRKRRRS